MSTLELTASAREPTHRERKKQATRLAIHRAALDLVEQLGLSRATIETISERAGVAPRTFWSYYSSKEGAVIDQDSERPEHLKLALLARPPDEDTLRALQIVLQEDLERRLIDKQDALRRARLVRSEPPLMAAVAAQFEQIERALVTGVAERIGLDPETDLYPAVVVSAACGACRVAQVRWGRRNGDPGLAELVDEAFKQLAAGLPSPPATRGPQPVGGTRP